MPTTVIEGITTRYEVAGAGPPLLMFSPGGFDATVENWTSLGAYRRLNLLDRLATRYTCITFDRREAGRSGGRVERIGWADYVAQGNGLLEHLGVGRAALMGGCVGCSTAAGFAVAHPEKVTGMVLFSPAGGAKYRLKQQARFAQHLAYVAEHGLEQVLALARGQERTFGSDPRVGPWGGAIRQDGALAEVYRSWDPDRYQRLVAGMARLLFDRDTVPGVEPEDLLQLDVPALIVPGGDESHAPSAARYLQECLPAARYWDVSVPEQPAAAVADTVVEFLGSL